MLILKGLILKFKVMVEIVSNWLKVFANWFNMNNCEKTMFNWTNELQYLKEQTV